MALAGRVIASHFAEPLVRRLSAPAALLAAPEDGAEVLAQLVENAELAMLDNSRGWAWGYAAGLVGYVRSAAVR
ncbi:SH3 domain-containing protein [Sphingomonas arvum]|uniref:SH3 domain-containing protein n=1 Tax=Sphingomonas arvum TaxID=2992113 RepID=UPI0038B2F77A